MDKLNKLYTKENLDTRFFQIYFEKPIGNTLDDCLNKEELKNLDRNKIIKVINNDCILTPDSWNEYKDLFFDQRMKGYKKSCLIEQKIELEIEKLKLLTLKNDDYKVLAANYKKLLINKKDELNRQLNKKSKQEKKTSYEWQGNQDKDLPELHKLMTDKYKLIASETTQKQIEAVFTAKPIQSINPIKWHQDNASELLYFIIKLEQSNNIVHNPKKTDYQRLDACFINTDGKRFNVKWKSLKTNLRINLSQDKQDAIDKLVKEF